MDNIDFKFLIQNIETAVVIADYDSKIIFANSSFCKLFNRGGLNLNGKNLFEYLPTNLQELEIKGLRYRILKLDNELYSYFYLQPMGNELETVYSEFISTVSHELRTPLTSIRGFADTMLMSYERLQQPQIQKFLEIIKEQSNRLIKLVENLLSISKIQAQQSNLVLKSINPRYQIEKVVEIVKNQYPSNNFEIVSEKTIPNIFADENKFQQIMINLLDNAAKYSFENGCIKVYIGNSQKENYLSIKIQDNGVGIEQKNLSKVFEKFARIENHLTRKTEGSGLGLYIVKNLVEKMGGSISVNSSVELPHSGSIFEILLPIASYTGQCKLKLEDK